MRSINIINVRICYKVHLLVLELSNTKLFPSIRWLADTQILDLALHIDAQDGPDDRWLDVQMVRWSKFQMLKV